MIPLTQIIVKTEVKLIPLTQIIVKTWIKLIFLTQIIVKTEVKLIPLTQIIVKTEVKLIPLTQIIVKTEVTHIDISFPWLGTFQRTSSFISQFWLFYTDPLLFLLSKPFNYLAFQSFDFEHT